jgi:hypothetical protein
MIHLRREDFPSVGPFAPDLECIRVCLLDSDDSFLTFSPILLERQVEKDGVGAQKMLMNMVLFAGCSNADGHRFGSQPGTVLLANRHRSVFQPLNLGRLRPCVEPSSSPVQLQYCSCLLSGDATIWRLRMKGWKVRSCEGSLCDRLTSWHMSIRGEDEVTKTMSGTRSGTGACGARGETASKTFTTTNKMSGERNEKSMLGH